MPTEAAKSDVQVYFLPSVIDRELPTTSESGSATIESPASRTISNTPGKTIPHRSKFGSIVAELSDEVGGSAFAIIPFIDAADDIDPKRPISQITVSAGWVVGGIECVLISSVVLSYILNIHARFRRRLW